MGFVGLTEATRRHRDERGAQMFAAVVQRMLGVSDNLRIKIARLPRQALRHRMEKRLHRFHNQFPGTGGV